MSWSIISGALSGGITGAIYGAEIANVYGAIIGFVVGAVVGGGMGWGAEAIARSNADYPGVPIQNLILPGNTIGSVVTDICGTAKISGQFLIYGDEKVLPITTEGGGKGGGSQSVTTGYMYYMSCYGLTAILYLLKSSWHGCGEHRSYGLTAILYLLKFRYSILTAARGYGLTAILYLLK